MSILIEISILLFLFLLAAGGLIHNWLLEKEVSRTRPLNVIAPRTIFSIFHFNIILLGVSLMIILLIMLFLVLLQA